MTFPHKFISPLLRRSAQRRRTTTILRRYPHRTSDRLAPTTDVLSVSSSVARVRGKEQGGSESVSMGQRNRRKPKKKPIMKPKKKPKMRHDFFTNLPSEIIIDILSRLPVRAVINCKYVCKSWLNLLKTHEFAKSHFSKSVAGLVVSDYDSCRIFEIDDVLDLEDHELHYIPVTDFDCSECGVIQGSANGLLFLYNQHCQDPFLGYDDLNIVNPITREYIRVTDPLKNFAYGYHEHFTYGFGVGRKTGQHTVVRIFHRYGMNEEIIDTTFPSTEAQAYTLGTRMWRSIDPGSMLEYDHDRIGVFINGNLHWLAFDENSNPWISCFDLDDELFSVFPSPPVLSAQLRCYLQLCALENCLCLSDNVSEDEFVIWIMKDYRVPKSWTKDFVISKSQIPNFRPEGDDHNAYPVKVFKNGDILMAWGELCFFYYSTKTKTCHEISIFERDMDAILHTSSFISLKCFVKERVRSIRY